MQARQRMDDSQCQLMADHRDGNEDRIGNNAEHRGAMCKARHVHADVLGAAGRRRARRRVVMGRVVMGRHVCRSGLHGHAAISGQGGRNKAVHNGAEYKQHRGDDSNKASAGSEPHACRIGLQIAIGKHKVVIARNRDCWIPEAGIVGSIDEGGDLIFFLEPLALQFLSLIQEFGGHGPEIGSHRVIGDGICHAQRPRRFGFEFFCVRHGASLHVARLDVDVGCAGVG
jgi:hypothetical protein